MRYRHLFLTALCLFGQSPESIRPTGSMRLAGFVHDPKALARAHDVEVQGNLAFVPGKGGHVAIIDIANPSRPRVISCLCDSTQFEDAEAVIPRGDVLFVGARDFFSVDISDPSRPKVLKKIANRPRIDRINDMVPWKHFLFTANKSGYIGVIDVADPRDPKLHDILDTQQNGGLSSPHGVAATKDHIVVVNTGRSEPVHVRVYRITDASGNLLPAAQWKAEGYAPAPGHVAQKDSTLHGANRVATWSRFVAVGAFVFDRVAIFEMPRPGQLREISSVPACDMDATGMSISGSILFVAGGECAEAIDVTDPTKPVSVAQYRGGNLFPTRAIRAGNETRYDNGHDLVYRDGFLYVTAQNDDRLGIIEILDPDIRRKAGSKQ